MPHRFRCLASRALLGLIIGPSFSGIVHANTLITGWDFQGTAADTATPLVTSTPAADLGTTSLGAASTLGMTNSYTATGGITGSVDGSNIEGADPGSSDTATTNFAWRIVGGAGTGADKGNGWSSQAPIGTQGAQFMVDTSGYSAISVQFDWGATTQGEANLEVLYTLDGSTWTNIPVTFTGTATPMTAGQAAAASVLVNSTSANTVMGTYLQGLSAKGAWYTKIVADFSAIPGASNNPNFGVRFVNASTGADCIAQAGSALNNTSGNWRFDEVQVSGTPPVFTAPTIVSQPVGVTLYAGGSSTLSVLASGNPAPTYQWYLGSSAISGATNSTLALSDVQSSAGGDYTVVVSNSQGSITSSVATLVVDQPVAPAISAQPASQTAIDGSYVTLSVTASASPAPTYQWYFNGTAISGAASSSYGFTAIPSSAGSYTVVVSNTFTNATSSAATVAVNTPNLGTILCGWDFQNLPVATDLTPAADLGTPLAGSASTLGMNNSYPTPDASVDISDVEGGAGGDTGSSDPAGYNNQAWRVRGGPAITGQTANGWSSLAPVGSQGAQFLVNTVGFTGIKLRFDVETTAKAEGNLEVLYTLNGSTWNNIPITITTLPSTGNTATVLVNSTSPNTVQGTYVNLAGSGTWFNGIEADFSGVAGVANDPKFGIRIVNASTGPDCVDQSGAAYNNSSGNWRFDEVQVLGVAYSAPARQSITFAPIVGATVGVSVTLSATASSGLPVTFAVQSGNATITGGNTLAINDANPVTIAASQPGNSQYAAATTVTQTITAAAGSPQLFFGQIGSGSLGADSRLVPHADSVATNLAAFVNGSGTGGTLIGYISDINAGFVVNFTLSGGGFTAATNAITGAGSVGQTLTFAGTDSDGLISGTIDELGLSFSAAAEPASGSSSAVSGLYQATGSSTAAYSIVGTQGDVFMLAVTPSGVGAGSGTVNADDSFTVQTTLGTAAAISGSVSPATLAITGTILPVGGSPISYSGESSVNAPAITPASQTVSAGSTATLSVSGAAAGSAYQWQLNGVNVAGATGSTLNLANIGTTQGGTYTALVTSSGTTAVSSMGAVVVTTDAWLANLSARAYVAPTIGGDDILIAGFVTTGPASKRILIRADGPALDAFGIGGFLTNPQLTLYSGSTAIVTKTGWDSSLSSLFATLGAFGLAPGSNDAAVSVSVTPGAYTAQTGSTNGQDGIALAEIYDADSGAPTNRLVNFSGRAYVGMGANILIGGFVIEGPANGGTSETVLIRAVGPALSAAPFNMAGTLANPVLSVYDGGSTPRLVAAMAGWDAAPTAGTSTVAAGLQPATAAVMASAGAFSFASGSADSAMVLTLPPGAYTAEVSSATGGTGIALIEIYEVR